MTTTRPPNPHIVATLVATRVIASPDEIQDHDLDTLAAAADQLGIDWDPDNYDPVGLAHIVRDRILWPTRI